MRVRRVAWFAAAIALALPCTISSSIALDQVAIHRMAALQYEVPNLVEEAVAEWIKVLALSPADAEARSHADTLVRKQMPKWLPAEAERAAPFKCAILTWQWQEQSPAQRFLVTEVDFAAREGERWDELHESGFTHIDYGYVWAQEKRRYEARVVVHWEDPAQTELAHAAMRATLIFYVLAREQLGFDPTRPWGDPVDVWITNKGEPGARAQGSSIYLYAANTQRTPGEWLREIAHEYGHVCMPGIGGFSQTDDAWADGHLAELLFPKWLGEAAAPQWLPWPAQVWEAEAAAERGRLMGAWTEETVNGMIGKSVGGLPPALSGSDAKARDTFLGLALRVEAMKGPRFLGVILKKCPRANAQQFVGALMKQRPSEQL